MLSFSRRTKNKRTHLAYLQNSSQQLWFMGAELSEGPCDGKSRVGNVMVDMSENIKRAQIKLNKSNSSFFPQFNWKIW